MGEGGNHKKNACKIISPWLVKILVQAVGRGAVDKRAWPLLTLTFALLYLCIAVHPLQEIFFGMPHYFDPIRRNMY